MTSLLPSKAAIAAATASNALFKPNKRPVGLFLGGTSGIGQAMAEQLARQTNGNVHIVLLGRNQAAAEKIISGFPQTLESKYSFVKVDATSMAQVREVTSKLSSELEKINFIVTSTGFLTTKGRDETSEGIDRKLACHFYARFRFIHDLVPLVEKAAEDGEQTGIASIFAPNRGGAVDLNDLGLVKGYSLRNAEAHGVTYTDSVFQEFAKHYPKLGFYHIFPGAVTTPGVTNITGSRFFLPFISFMTVSPAECAQVMWWRIWSTDAQWNTGAHEVGNRGDAIIPSNRFVTDEGKKAIWEHALKLTS